MDMTNFFEGLLNVKLSPIVICDMNYRIIYMNDYAAVAYAEYGGRDMLGKLLNVYFSEETMSKVYMVIEFFKENPDKNFIFSHHFEETNSDAYIVAIRDKNGELIGFSSAHRRRTPEEGEPYEFD